MPHHPLELLHRPARHGPVRVAGEREGGTSRSASVLPLVARATGTPHDAERLVVGRRVADRLVDLGAVHLLGYPGFGGVPADPGVKSPEPERVARLVLVAGRRAAGREVAVANGHVFAFARGVGTHVFHLGVLKGWEPAPPLCPVD